jgi:hypothetical protein
VQHVVDPLGGDGAQITSYDAKDGVRAGMRVLRQRAQDGQAGRPAVLKARLKLTAAGEASESTPRDSSITACTTK